MIKSTALAAVALNLSIETPGFAQCDPQWLPGEGVPGVSGIVNAMRLFTVNGTTSLYVAGDFSLVGSQPANRIASWNGSSWTPLDPGMPQEEYGAILAMTELDEKLIIAGGFSSINGGQPANQVAQWDGLSWTPVGGDPPGNQINALTVWNGQLVAGCQDYDEIGPVGRVAVWDGKSWGQLGASMNEYIYALTVHDGQLIAGGEFTDIGGQQINRIARWNGAAWEQLGDGFDQRVVAFAQLQGELIAGGWFMNSGSTPVRAVARWDGATWQPYGDGPSGSAFGIGIYKGTIVASGSSGPGGFTQQWNGTAWAPLGAEPNGYGSGVVEFEGSLYVGGFFHHSGSSVSISNIGRWDGAQWHTVGDADGFNFYAEAFATFNDSLVVGGSFTFFDGENVGGVARLNGSTWEPLGDNMAGVRDLVEYNGDLYAGGFFRAATGAPADYVVRWDGVAWHALGSGVNGIVNALAIHDGYLYVGGNFTLAGGVPRQRIARWDGSNWESVGTGLNNVVWELISYNGSIVAAGTFTIDDGAPSGPDRGGIASFTPGSGWALVGGGTSGSVVALAVYNDDLIAGGMHEAGDTEVNEIARWDGEQWHALGDGIPSGIVDVLTTFAGELIVGGYFLKMNGDPGNFVARWDGAEWHELDGGVDDRVFALHEFDGVLYVGGLFALAGGEPSASVARAAITGASPGDTNCDGEIDVDDLLAVINGWGACSGCPGDLNGDNEIDVDDLLIVINNWSAGP